MTHFISAWAPPGRTLDPALVTELQAAMAPAGALETVSLPRFAAVLWDSGLWPGRSVCSIHGRSAVVAGNPVVVLNSGPLGRERSVTWLCDQLLTGGVQARCAAEGTYAAITWDQTGAALAITDKLGVRSVYWARAGETVIVSSTLWALARVNSLALSPDLRGAVETCAFGAPLADRTLMAGVHALGAGECIDLTGHAPVVQCYHDWATLAPSGVPERELPEFIAQAFDDAVDARIEGQTRAFAFLSGGMDSRLVVARLRHRGLAIGSMNFAPPGSQDLLFGQMAAQAMGIRLFEFDDDGATFLVRRGRAFDAWGRDPANEGLRPERDRLVWSGDGGSVALGHVYLTEQIVAAARQQGVKAAAWEIQNSNRFILSPRSFSREHRDATEWPLEGILADLQSRDGVEPGRNAHLFFMLNDQRRHLVVHYESLHETRLDLVLPFFDGRFLKAVLSSPIDPFLLHRLYNRIMAIQPFGLGQVPWQVYPGHEPCPVKVKDAGRLQWDEGWFGSGRRRKAERARMLQSLRMVLSSRFPADVLSRPALLGAALMGLAGAPQYEYLLNPIGPLRKAMDMSGGVRPRPGSGRS